MQPISANDLKTKGVGAIDQALLSDPEADVTVRGEVKYVVMSKDHYGYLREGVADDTKALSLLEANPHRPSLRLRALKCKLAGLHSVSITMAYRITLELIVTEKDIILIHVGDHDDVYR